MTRKGDPIIEYFNDCKCPGHLPLKQAEGHTEMIHSVDQVLESLSHEITQALGVWP